MKRYAIALPLLVLMISCTDSDLQKIGKSMLILANGLKEVQTDVITANQSKLIDDATTGQILSICTRIDVAGKQVDTVMRSISKLDPASRTSLVNLLTPISQALDPNQISFVAGIKDPVTQQKVQGEFIILRSAVSAIQLVLATGG
jgi:hypothetical protein